MPPMSTRVKMLLFIPSIHWATREFPQMAHFQDTILIEILWGVFRVGKPCYLIRINYRAYKFSRKFTKINTKIHAHLGGARKLIRAEIYEIRAARVREN